MNVAGPCLVFESLARLVLPLAEFFAMVGAAVAIMLVTALASFVLLKVLRLPIRSYLPALTIGNVGNLGCRCACSRSASRGSRSASRCT